MIAPQRGMGVVASEPTANRACGAVRRASFTIAGD